MLLCPDRSQARSVNQSVGVPSRHSLDRCCVGTLAMSCSIGGALALLVATIATDAFADPAGIPAERIGPHADRAAIRSRKAQVEFDAVALQALIAPMLSGAKSGPVGSGPAGRYWQSLMAEHVARHIASSGRLQLLPKLPSAPAVSAPTSFAKRQLWRGGDGRRDAATASSWQTTVFPAADRGPVSADRSN